MSSLNRGENIYHHRLFIKKDDVDLWYALFARLMDVLGGL
jgi:hypothetical protein